MKESIGTLGALCVLCAFALSKVGKLSVNRLPYDVLNAVGSLSLVIYATLLHSTPFILINAVWFALSIWSAARAK